MKKFSILIVFAFVLFACTKEKTVTISGTITNPLAETIVVQNLYLDQKDTIDLTEDGSFLVQMKVQMKIDKEYVAYLWNGNLPITLYLIPGADIHLNFDGEDFAKNPVSGSAVSGEKSAATKLLVNIQDIDLRLSVPLMKMPVDSFAMKVDSIKALIDNEIESFSAENKLSQQFIDVVKLIEQVKIGSYCDNYINYHPQFAAEDTTTIPDSFQENIDAIPLENVEKYIGIRDYKSFITAHFQKEMQKSLKADTTLSRGSVAYYDKTIDAILALPAPKDVKESIGYSLVASYSYMPDSIQQLIKERYKEIISKEIYVSQFEKTLAAIEKTKPGTVAPTFNYPDINGNMVSSESLKGKVVYIDVWATWCGPCKGEIPSLKKMETELHDQPIAFVSISIDDDKAAWEKMVKDDELQGYQLFAENAWNSDIANAYAIRGIPRFIMVDKEGKIVNANATRPSNPETKEKLLELAAE